MKLDLVRMRLQTTYLINAGLPVEKQYRDPRHLMPFKFDEEYVAPQVYIPTEEEWEEMDRRYAEVNKGKSHLKEPMYAERILRDKDLE